MADEAKAVEAKLAEMSVGDEGKHQAGGEEGKQDAPSTSTAAAAAAAAAPAPSPAPSPADEWAEYNEENIPDVEVNGKSYKALADGEYDAIIMSTGLKECVLAGLLAVRGLKVLQIDRNPYYGGACASLNLEELYKHFNKPYDEAKVTSALGNPRRFCVDLVPKLLMANGKLVKMLLQTGVTRYIDFAGIDGSYVLNGTKIYKVPVTPAEALKTSLVGFFQKRNLRNFAEFLGRWQAPDRTYQRRFLSMSAVDFRAGVVAYYQVHNPSKLSDIDDLLAKMENRRVELIAAMEQRYGIPVFPIESTMTVIDGPLGIQIESSPAASAVAGAPPNVTVVRVLAYGQMPDGSMGQAEKSGKVAPGDILASINGESFIGKTDNDVKVVLTSAPRPLKMTFMKPCVHLDGPNAGTVVGSAQGNAAGNEDLSKVTMRELFTRFGLDENSQNFIGHAMALQTDDRYLDLPAEETMAAAQLYGRSMGLYGQDSPYLYPMYGLSSLPEGFSRLAAIYGGTVMLRTQVDEILMDANGRALGVRSGERVAKGKYIIGDASFFPPEKSRNTDKIVRSICFLREPLPKTNGQSAQVILPSKHLKGKTHDVYISEIGPALQVSPKGVFIAIASTTVETNDPVAELEPAFKLMGPIVERFDSVTQGVAPVENGRRDNCFITSTLDATSHFESAALDIMDIYQHIFNKPLDLAEKLVEDPNQ